MARSKKATVVAAFNLRLPVIALSIGRMIFTQRLCDSSTDPGLGSALAIIWLEIETSYALVSNTFSALKAFTVDFNSTFGLGFTANADPQSYTLYPSKAGTGNGSRLPTLQSKSSATRQEEQDYRTPGNISKVSSEPLATAHANERNNSQRKKDLVIVRTTEYSIQHSDSSDEVPILSDTSHSRT